MYTQGDIYTHGPHGYRDTHIYTYTYKQTHTPAQMTISVNDLECLN